MRREVAVLRKNAPTVLDRAVAPIPLLIFGCGGFAREVYWAAGNAASRPGGLKFRVLGFVDRESRREPFYNLPVWSLKEAPREACIICGIGGMPELKQRVMEEAEAAGRIAALPVVFDGVPIGPHCSIGTGSVICAGNILTVDITVGRHVAINLDCTVGHDSVIGDYATLSPGVHVSGNVRIGTGAYIGTGASIIEGVTIGDYAVVGAGAVVTRDVAPLSLVVGVPATLKKAERELVCVPPGFVDPRDERHRAA